MYRIPSKYCCYNMQKGVNIKLCYSKNSHNPHSSIDLFSQYLMINILVMTISELLSTKGVIFWGPTSGGIVSWVFLDLVIRVNCLLPIVDFIDKSQASCKLVGLEFHDYTHLPSSKPLNKTASQIGSNTVIF